MVINLSLVDQWFDHFERSGLQVESLEDLIMRVLDEAGSAKALGRHRVSLQVVTVALVGRGETWHWQVTDPRDIFVMSQIPARLNCGPDTLIIGPICVMHTKQDRVGVELPAVVDLEIPNTEAIEQALDNLFPQFIEISLVDTLTRQKWRWVR